MLSAEEIRERNRLRQQKRRLDPAYREREAAAQRLRSMVRYHADLPASRQENREKKRRHPPTEEQRRAKRQRDRERYLRNRDDPDLRERRARAEALRERRGRSTQVRREQRARERSRLAEQQALTKAAATPGYRFWTPEEDREVMRTDLTILEIALRLDRTRASVTTRRRDLRRVRAGD